MLTKLCCFHTELCKCSCGGMSRNKNVKLGYIILMLLFIPVIYILGPISNPEPMGDNIQIVCYGLALMHLVLGGLMFMQSDKVKIINEGVWIIKGIVVFVVVVVLKLVLAHHVLQWMADVSIVFSSLVYLMEGLVLVDLVYAFDATFDEQGKQNKNCLIFKLILSVLVLLFAGFLCFLGYDYNQQWIAITNIALLVVFLAIAVLRIFKDNNILVAVLVSTLLCLVSFTMPRTHYFSETTILVFKGIFFIILLVGMLTQGSNMVRTRKSSLNEILALNTSPNEEDNRYVSSNKWKTYHLIMAIILLGVPGVFCWEGSGSFEIIRMSHLVSWGGLILWYVWSLVAMKVCPSEDFSQLENYFREYELR